MSVQGIKTCLMTAACLGLMGVVATDVSAFGGKKDGCCADPCAAPCPAPCPDPCADSCGKGKKRGGLHDWFARRGSRGECCPNPCDNPCGPVAAPCPPAPCPPAPAPAPVMQKVKVQQWVPTWVEECVTVMKPTKQIQTYTAHRWECVPQTVTCQVTVNKMVTETVMENRCVTERVPVQKTVCVTERVPVQKTVTVQERVPVQKVVTVMEKRPVQKTVCVNETVWKNVMVTEMVQKKVTHKVQVPYCETKGPTIHDRLKKLCDPCYEPCPRTVSGCRTEKVCETVCCPVTKCKKVCETVPVTKTICTYECVPVQKTVCTYECRPVQKTITCYECVQVQKQVTCYECVTKTVAVPCTRTRCVPTCETVTKTVNVRKCVPYQATREVTVCVPVQETRKVCKMVCQVVEKEVPCAPHAAACPNPCDTGAGACCDSGRRGGLFSRLFGHRGKKGNDCCGAAAGGAAAGCCH